MKMKIILSLIALVMCLSSLELSATVPDGTEEGTYSYSKVTKNGQSPWWSLGTVTRYAKTSKTDDTDSKNNRKIRITCTDPGDDPCPDAKQDVDDNLLTPDPGVSTTGQMVNYQAFCEYSKNLLLQHVYEQAADGVFTGSYSLNTVIDGVTYYRTVDWDGDANESNINIYITPENSLGIQ